MIISEKFVVVYARKDLSNTNWIKLEKEFHFKDEALCFADKVQESTGQKVSVYKKVIKYERIA